MMNFIFSEEKAKNRVFFTDESGNVLGFSNLPQKDKEKISCLIKNELFLNGNTAVYSHFDMEEQITSYYVSAKGEVGAQSIKSAVYAVSDRIKKDKAKEIQLMIPDFEEELSPIAEAFAMSLYSYSEFITAKLPQLIEEILIFGEENSCKNKFLNQGSVLGEAVCISRDLVNEPANTQTPLKLSQEIENLGKEYGFETEVLLDDGIEKINAKAFLEVGKASCNKPAFVIMRYNGNKESSYRFGLIGKGVTYDSGGLNLKSGARFITMKHDMAGAATVIGAMCALAKLKIKVNVTAIVAACENVIDSNAYKPGDIIESMAGKTIQITSTDAEGRLTMIDALYYAAKHEAVDCLIDIATLTGAARKMLGDYGAPYMSTDNDLALKFESAAKVSDELVVRLPFIEKAKKLLDCDVADYVNSAKGEVCGAITAGLFLREFTCCLPYVHIDGAGPLWLEQSFDGFIKGGSGWGVRTLFHMLSAI